MKNDAIFYGSIVAMFAFMTGSPFIALTIFLLSLLAS
jgi:uncharacterized membrane protein